MHHRLPFLPLGVVHACNTRGCFRNGPHHVGLRSTLAQLIEAILCRLHNNETYYRLCLTWVRRYLFGPPLSSDLLTCGLPISTPLADSVEARHRRVALHLPYGQATPVHVGKGAQSVLAPARANAGSPVLTRLKRKTKKFLWLGRDTETTASSFCSSLFVFYSSDSGWEFVL